MYNIFNSVYWPFKAKCCQSENWADHGNILHVISQLANKFAKFPSESKKRRTLENNIKINNYFYENIICYWFHHKYLLTCLAEVRLWFSLIIITYWNNLLIPLSFTDEFQEFLSFTFNRDLSFMEREDRWNKNHFFYAKFLPWLQWSQTLEICWYVVLKLIKFIFNDNFFYFIWT